MNINLPNNWTPRDYQQPLWDALKNTNQEGGLKRFMSVWHRRAGKDDVYMHHNACAAFERVGNYWYMLPEYSQCRKAIWDAVNPHTGKRRIDEAFPKEIRKNTREDEMKIIFANGSTWQLMGSDKYDSLVGSPPIGLTYSEYAISNPSSWGYLRPILLENGGWAAFNTTPRGKNHAKKMLDMARESKDWFSQVLTADQTSVFTKEQLYSELEELISEHGEQYGKSLWLQEYYCSFDAAVPGSIWGDSLSKLEANGRIGYVPHTEGYQVFTAWDLGRDDDTSIWFYQVVNNELKVIDHYAKNFIEIDDLAKVLRDKVVERKFEFGTHWLPHDARPTRLGMGGRSVLKQFMDCAAQILADEYIEIGQFSVTPSFSRDQGIKEARKVFEIAHFDKDHCENGVESLKAYHRKYDSEKKVFSDEPVHDWSSHDSDAWRYVALTYKESAKNQIIKPSLNEELMNGSIVKASFGQIRDKHLKKMKSQRNNLFR
jgi:hypothetical protein